MRSGKYLVFACCLTLLNPAGSDLLASFHVPYQTAGGRLGCGQRPAGGGYFRPEYGELVQRLDPEAMDWLVRTWPVLGWNGMDPRVYTPKSIPSGGQSGGFRYDTSRRNLRLEALFHFGPLGGNGTLIDELLELDGNRLLTVNRGSRNISVIDADKPDVAAVIPTALWLESLDFNLATQELYLVERGARGMLVWSLRNYSFTDTLHLAFHPGVVLLSVDSRYIYLTDETQGALLRIDLTKPGERPERLTTGLPGPYFLAEDRETGLLALVSVGEGRVALIDPEGFHKLDEELHLGGRLLAWCAPKEAGDLYLAAGSCERSSVFCISSGGGEASIRKLADIGGAVTALGADDKGGTVCALSGRELYSIDSSGAGEIRQRSLPGDPQRVLPEGGRVFVSAGLDGLYVLDRDLADKPLKVQVELGPGPLLARKGAVWVANCLSNSLTVIDSDKLREQVSVLVGVLLGRMVLQDGRIAVNNLFRGNVMVLNPETYVIEEIVPVGGSMYYSRPARRVTMFDDSLVTGMDFPPSSVAISSRLDIPQGVRLFAPTGDPQSFLVADQQRTVQRIDLDKRFRFGGVPLPDEAVGMFVRENDAWVLADNDLYRFGVTETIGLSQSYPLRPFKFLPPYVASDYSNNYGGSQIHVIYNTQVLDLASTPGAIIVISADPDTSFYYFGTSRNVKVYDRRDNHELATIPLDGVAEDIYLPSGSLQGYITGGGRLKVVDRQTFFQRDELELDGAFVYGSGDDLYLRDRLDPQRLFVVDGYRGNLFQELRLPVVPVDAAAEPDRLYLLGGADGAIAIYVNLLATERLPRSSDRSVWDTQADRRTGTHR